MHNINLLRMHGPKVINILQKQKLKRSLIHNWNLQDCWKSIFNCPIFKICLQLSKYFAFLLHDSCYKYYYFNHLCYSCVILTRKIIKSKEFLLLCEWLYPTNVLAIIHNRKFNTLVVNKCIYCILLFTPK